MKTNSRLLSEADVGIIFRLAKHFNNEIVYQSGRKFYVDLKMNYIIVQIKMKYIIYKKEEKIKLN